MSDVVFLITGANLTPRIPGGLPGGAGGTLG